MSALRFIGVAMLLASPAFGQATYSPAVSPSDIAPVVQSQVQATNATTAADGSFSVTWARPFSAAPTMVTADVLGGNVPYICSILTKDANTATGRCFQVVSTTLPSAATALLGLTVSPIANPGAGLTIMVVGRL